MDAVADPRRLSARSGGLPVERGPQGTRRRLLEAALGLFAERGFAATSIRDIAAEASMPSATLYTHYESKEHVLADLVMLGHEEHHRRMREGLLGAGADPRDQLAALVRAHVGMHADFPRLATVANSEMHSLSPELAGPSTAIRGATTDLLLDVGRRGVSMGVFEPADLWLAVAAIGGMGIRVASWFTPESEMTVDYVADVYVEFALSIMRAAPAPPAGATPGS